MPLTLVTGPANAAKAGEVLGGLRARVDDEPILVVPAFQDVEHAQRELADRGAVFGVSVLRFDWLYREIARRTGHSERIASDVQRELIVEEAVRRARLELLAESAAQAGFVRAAARFVAELERSMVEPARFTQALRAWAGDGPRRRYADEIAAIYRGYRAGLDAAGLADPELFAWHSLDALRLDPARWGGTPVFVYGFDDFDQLQLDALDTLANRCGVDVVASLPFERGRAAFKSVATLHQELLELGARENVLPPLDDHYAPESRAALHHVERSLFEDDVERGRGGLRGRVSLRRRAARRDRARRRPAARPAARGRRAGRRGGSPAPAGRLRVVARAGLRRLRHPVLDRPLRPAVAHRARSRAAGAGALRRGSRRGRRGPAGLAAHARAAAPARAGRPARGHRAPRRGP